MTLAEPLKNSDLFVTSFVERLRELTKQEDAFVPLHEPTFKGEEWPLVKDCLVSGWVSSRGEHVDRFEAELAKRCGTTHCVAVVNGTAALHTAMIISGIKPGDEVILPTLTFVATANAVCHAGAIPHFVDSSTETLGLDPVSLKVHPNQIAKRKNGVTVNNATGQRIVAIVPVQFFGHPVDMDGLLKVADEFGLSVIEDAAEALGSLYKDKQCGSMGRLGVLSFNGNKIITTGGGGAILTNDPDLAKRAKHLTTTAKVPHKWASIHDEVGYNYRLPNIKAALGCAQLGQLDGFLTSKRHLAKRYFDGFAKISGLSVFQEPKFAKSNYWLNAVILDADHAEYRDALLQAANNAGFMCRPCCSLMRRLPMFRECPQSDLPVAEAIESRLINIPSSANLAASP